MSDLSVFKEVGQLDLTRVEQFSPEWNLVREACEHPTHGLYFFTKAIWCTHIVRPEDNLFSRRCHLAPCMTLSDPSIHNLLLEWPRRHGKTTLIEAAAVHATTQNPSLRIAFYSSTNTFSQRVWRETRAGFETNHLLQFFYPELIPDFRNVEVWNQTEGIIPRDFSPKEPTFDTLGGGKATGRHYDLIFMDDMINEENVDSETAVAKAIEYYRLAYNLLEDTDDRIIVVGNRWAMNDLNEFIHREQPDVSILTASVWGPKLEGDYKCRLLPPVIMEEVEKIPRDEPLWPERFDRPSLERWAERVGPRIWSAHGLNDPADPEAVEFKLNWLRSCSVDAEAKTIHFLGDEAPTPLSQCNVYITWDPALGGREATSRNAILVTAMDSKGRIAILREWARKGDPLEVIDVFLDFCQLYDPWLQSVGLEEVLFQQVLGTLLTRRAEERRIRLPIVKLKTPRNIRKDQRIRAWVGGLFQAGRVYVRQGLTEFTREYSHFGVPGASRDLMDVLAYATQLWTKPPSPEDEKLIEEEEKEMEYNMGVTGYGPPFRRRVAR